MRGVQARASVERSHRISRVSLDGLMLVNSLIHESLGALSAICIVRTDRPCQSSCKETSTINQDYLVMIRLLLKGMRGINNIYIYYIDTSVLLENIPLVKFIKTTSGTRVVYFP